MKRIDKWVTRDGAEFSDEARAESHEFLLDKIDAIESLLPERNSSTDFANGNGYIQHSRNQIIRAREKLVELACDYVLSEISKYDIRSYAFSRYLDDNNDALYRLYVRIVLCIDDDTWREYGQPYFAQHPEEVRG